MFEHPFIDRKSLEEKSLDELQSVIANLNSKLNFAYKTGNQPLINQLLMLLEGYRNQSRKRMDEMFAKQNMNTKISIETTNDSSIQAPISPFGNLGR